MSPLPCPLSRGIRRLLRVPPTTRPRTLTTFPRRCHTPPGPETSNTWCPPTAPLFSPTGSTPRLDDYQQGRRRLGLAVQVCITTTTTTTSMVGPSPVCLLPRRTRVCTSIGLKMLTRSHEIRFVVVDVLVVPSCFVLWLSLFVPTFISFFQKKAF